MMIERDRLKKVAYVSFIKSLGGGFKAKEDEIGELKK